MPPTSFCTLALVYYLRALHQVPQVGIHNTPKCVGVPGVRSCRHQHLTPGSKEEIMSIQCLLKNPICHSDPLASVSEWQRARAGQQSGGTSYRLAAGDSCYQAKKPNISCTKRSTQYILGSQI